MCLAHIGVVSRKKKMKKYKWRVQLRVVYRTHVTCTTVGWYKNFPSNEKKKKEHDGSIDTMI